MTQNVSEGSPETTENRSKDPNIRRGKYGGTLAPLWQPGQSPNPGGLPKGFVPLSKAYAYLSTLGPETIKLIADTGRFPAKWERDQCFTYIVAAKAWDELSKRPVPGLLAELADRTEGRVPQKINAEVSGAGILVLPVAQMGSLAWRDDVIDAQAIETGRLTGSDSEMRRE